jgi:N-acetylmuramoyl-L-alanine amidase
VRTTTALLVGPLLALSLPSDAKTVLIDVGHSEKVAGATGASGRTEFSYNRSLSIQIADSMRRLGWKVVMPNLDGRVSTLLERPESARNAKADLFIAVHHDSVQEWQMPNRDRYGGFSVWIAGTRPAAKGSLRCGRSVGQAMKASGMTPNLSHAQPPPGAGRNLLDPSIGLYRRDSLAVLKHSTTPAILVEAGVIVNPAEEHWLGRRDVQRMIAGAVADGADRCIATGNKGAER